MTAHTPAPWTLNWSKPFGQARHAFGARYQPPYMVINAGGGNFDRDTGKGFHLTGVVGLADANLIAAAPSMIDALCQWAVAEAAGDEQELKNARLSRDAAIADAMGDST